MNTDSMGVRPLQPLSDDFAVRAVLAAATQHAKDIARPDGHWVGELCANPTITAEYVFLYQALQSDRLTNSGDDIVRWLLSEQQADGSWTIAYSHPGDVSTTTEVYLALKILGLPTQHVAMQAAKRFILRAGGIEKVRIFTRFYLACFGLWPWTAVPEMPAELILLPQWAPVNIYRFSSWARSTIVPLLIVCHHRPVFRLPCSVSDAETFLDELWSSSLDKNVHYSKSIRELATSDWIESLFTVIDNTLSYLDGLRWSSITRGLARRRCLAWILEHQECEGDWAGIYPPMHFGVLALVLEGYLLESPEIRSAFEAIDRFAWHDVQGTRIQSCVSPVWDTVLMIIGLCDAGSSRHDLERAVAWTRARQLKGPEGDWRVYSRSSVSGGFSFEYFNAWYPDVDDTAAAVIAFLKHDPNLASSACVVDAVTWLLSMQNGDGGWAAFDKENDKLWLNKIPFSDMDSLCDPSTADVTARILEALGLLMEKTSLKHAYHIVHLLVPIEVAVKRAIAYLAATQEANGAWYGRWGVNYIYGTSNVLCCLEYYSADATVGSMIAAAVNWLQSVQNDDGGWGECLDSYKDPGLAGKGTSTASQTAWALMGLLAHVRISQDCLKQGIQWLLAHFDQATGSWPEHEYTGTGFPDHFYIRYELYATYFPIMALGRYIERLRWRDNDDDTADAIPNHEEVQDGSTYDPSIKMSS